MRISIDSDRFPNPQSVVYLKKYLAQHPDLEEVDVAVNDVDLRITCGDPDHVDIDGPALMTQFGTGTCASAAAPGFWESWFGEDGTEFGIWGKNDRSSPWEPLLTGRFRTQASPSENFARITIEPLAHLCAALDSFAATKVLPRSSSAQRLAPASGKTPSWVNRFMANVKYSARQARRATRRLQRGRPRTWAVSYLIDPDPKPDWSTSTFIEAPRGHFFADPFLVDVNGQRICLVEDFDTTLERACITAIRIHDAKTYEILGPIIREPFHLSFPFPLTFQDRLFVVPESADARQIRMYECTEFPDTWELNSVLMDDVEAYDTQIFPVEDRWSLLTTLIPTGMRDIDSRLSEFEATAPIAQQWMASSPLPIHVDPVGSRNAGFIEHPEGVIRAAQASTMSTYGSGLRIPGRPEFAQWEFDGGHHLHVTSWGAVRDWLEPEFS
jgi:hypothetical protein